MGLLCARGSCACAGPAPAFQTSLPEPGLPQGPGYQDMALPLGQHCGSQGLLSWLQGLSSCQPQLHGCCITTCSLFHIFTALLLHSRNSEEHAQLHFSPTPSEEFLQEGSCGSGTTQSAEPRFSLHDLNWEQPHLKQQQTLIFPGRSCIPGSWQALPPPWPWHSPTASQAEQNTSPRAHLH